MDKVARTVIVPSIILSRKKYETSRELEEIYSEIIRELVDCGFKNSVKSFTKLKKFKYHELRKKYPQLPSHYIHVACQDVSTRIRSFLKLKRRGLAKSDKPVVKRVSIWLDDHLWKPIGYTAIKIATHRGWITVELQPHKLYWKCLNNGWKLRIQPKLKLCHKERRVYVYFIFEKEVENNISDVRGVVSVDVNENNVTVKVGSKIFILQTNIKKITLGYASYREVMQSIKGNRYVRRTIHDRERKVKRDIKYKIANIIANTAKQLGAIVVLEDLPKQCPKNMISNVKNKRLRHRIYQVGFRGCIKAIEEKCIERGVPINKINPKGTSSTCPFCGSKLMRGNAPRHLRCPKCKIDMGRDAVAVLNLEEKHLTLKGCVPFTPMPNEFTLEVAALPMKEWMRWKSLPQTQYAIDLNRMKR